MTYVGVALLAVLLVIAGLTLRTRNKTIEHSEYEQEQHHNSNRDKQVRKAQRAQSRNARRKRH
jgi:hypothetical protein